MASPAAWAARAASRGLADIYGPSDAELLAGSLNAAVACLDACQDVAAVGALERSEMWFVNPGRPIPAESTEITGSVRSMAMGLPGLRDRFRVLCTEHRTIEPRSMPLEFLRVKAPHAEPLDGCCQSVGRLG